MRIAAKYSHLNGEEHLIVHRNHLWEQVKHVIDRVHAESCRTKQSREIRKQGHVLRQGRGVPAVPLVLIEVVQ